MHIKIHQWIVLLITCLSLSNCANTTGNPRQGGLFGWSEDKAKQRQENLNNKTQQAQDISAKELQNSKELQSSKRQHQQQVAQMERRLFRLIQENNKLRQNLDKLLEKKEVKSNILKQLMADLDALKLPQNVQNGFDNIQSTQQHEIYLDSLHRANELYTKAIIHMMQF